MRGERSRKTYICRSAPDPINVVMNEGPGLMIKEVPPDFDVIILTIIKVMIRYFCSKEMLYCCKLWIVSICKLWIDSIYKLWIILQSSASYYPNTFLEVHVCKYCAASMLVISSTNISARNILQVYFYKNSLFKSTLNVFYVIQVI